MPRTDTQISPEIALPIVEEQLNTWKAAHPEAAVALAQLWKDAMSVTGHKNIGRMIMGQTAEQILERRSARERTSRNGDDE